jgi:hypothetical protein
MADSQGSDDTNVTGILGSCRFLGVPVELRLLIYEHLFEPYWITLCLARETRYGKMIEDRVNANLFVRHRTGHLHPRVLMTCSQVYREAGLILYRPARLVFVKRCPPGMGDSFGRSFPVEKLSSVTRLSEIAISLETTANTLADIFFLQLLRNHLHNSLHVNQLVVSIAFGKDFWQKAESRDNTEQIICALTKGLTVSKCNIGYHDGPISMQSMVFEWHNGSGHGWREVWRREKVRNERRHTLFILKTVKSPRLQIAQVRIMQRFCLKLWRSTSSSTIAQARLNARVTDTILVRKELYH